VTKIFEADGRYQGRKFHLELDDEVGWITNDSMLDSALWFTLAQPVILVGTGPSVTADPKDPQSVRWVLDAICHEHVRYKGDVPAAFDPGPWDPDVVY